MINLIKLIRDNPNFVKKNYLRRRDPELIKKVDLIIEYDRKWRKGLNDLQELNRKRNEASVEISKLKGKEKEKKIKEVKELVEKIEKKKEKVEKLKEKIDKLLFQMPNLLHESVPYGKDDSENVVVKKWGEKRANYNPKSHVDILKEYKLADLEAAAKVSGARFYYLLGDMVKLDYALQMYALDFFINKGFLPVEPPLMLRKRPYEGVISFEDFKEMMYKIDGEDLYLIGTSEHPLVARYMNKTLNYKELPIKLVGISPCFRKEAGAHGKDTKGIFRVHVFNKVEQIIISTQEDSWKYHEELLKNEEEFFQSLGIPYRIVNVCTGDLGIVAAKKYDLEGWFPAQKKYRELCSCSNCTEWQSQRLNIKYVDNKGKRKYVHTLNATGVATSRAMVAIIENFQNKDGTIDIPKVLWNYMGGVTKLKPRE